MTNVRFSLSRQFQENQSLARGFRVHSFLSYDLSNSRALFKKNARSVLNSQGNRAVPPVRKKGLFNEDRLILLSSSIWKVVSIGSGGLGMGKSKIPFPKVPNGSGQPKLREIVADGFQTDLLYVLKSPVRPVQTFLALL